jgi:hypothetical protein
MADDTLPIVFKSNRYGAIVSIIFGIVVVWAAIAKITDDSYAYSGSQWGPVYLSSHTEGWLMAALGLPLVLYAAMAIVRGCPTLTLDESGILLSRCFGGPIHIPWNQLADVVIRTARIPGRGRTTVVDVVYLITKDGRDISVGTISGKASDIEGAIRRVAAIHEAAALSAPSARSASARA